MAVERLVACRTHAAKCVKVTGNPAHLHARAAPLFGRQLVLYVTHYQPSGPRAGELHTGLTGTAYRYRLDA